MLKTTFFNILKVQFARNILVTSTIIAITLLICHIILIFPSFTRMIIGNVEEQVSKIADVMILALPDQHELSSNSLSPELSHELEKIAEKFELMKLQVFSTHGKTLYSTDPKDVGVMNEGSYFREVVASRRTLSKMALKNTMSLEGQKVTLDVVETYVPIIENDVVLGVFEIYYDITKTKRSLDKLLYIFWAIEFILAISLLGAVIIVLKNAVENITKRKHAEDKLRKARDMLEQRVQERTGELARTNEQLKQEIDERIQMEKNLRKSRERFQALTESTCDWIWETDAGGSYTYASPKVKDLLGFMPSEVTGKTLFDFLLPEEAERVKSKFNAILHSKKPFSKLEIVNVHKKGQLVTLESSAVPFFDSNGCFCGYRGIDRDITEEQKLRKEADYTLQQIIHADKLASLGEMVAGVAHEINNPNSFITYNMPLLEETWQMFEPIVSEYASAHPQQRISGFRIEELCRDMRELIQDIKTGSGRINKIVSNLKDFVRSDESRQFKPVQVNETIEKAMAFVGSQVRRSVSKVKMDLDPSLPKIQGDFHKLEQVIANLVMNAVHAIPDKDNGSLFVATRHLERLSSVLIEIEDNGIGMEERVIEQIFDPFYTTRRDAGGTGLGLSVSHSLIQEHNGIIGVLSRPGLGTRFTLYLPVNSEKKLDLRPLILCLDDDAEFLGLLKMYFAEVRNMSIETKNKPESVVGYLENHPEIDIVLSDSRTFEVDSWNLIEKIKTRFPLLTVIHYSSDSNAFIKQKPDSAPAPDHFLQKPFKMERLLKIINTIGRQRL